MQEQTEQLDLQLSTLSKALQLLNTNNQLVYPHIRSVEYSAIQQCRRGLHLLNTILQNYDSITRTNTYFSALDRNLKIKETIETYSTQMDLLNSTYTLEEFSSIFQYIKEYQYLINENLTIDEALIQIDEAYTEDSKFCLSSDEISMLSGAASALDSLKDQDATMFLIWIIIMLLSIFAKKHKAE